jgi:GAF domain-containing protein
VTAVSAQRMATIFVEVADTLDDEFDLLGFLHLLTDRAAVLVGAAAAGISLADPHGQLEFMAGSDQDVTLVEMSELEDQEGPGLDAFHTGRAVFDVDLSAAATRWPRFAPSATAVGYQAVHAFPLRARDHAIGAMSVFGVGRGGDFRGGDVAIMQSLADVAAIGLLQERIIHRSQVHTGQLQSALDSRVAVEQAKGAVAHARGITVDEAFALIRDYARSQHRQLTVLANKIIADPATIDLL